LQREIASIKHKVALFEEGTHQNRWGIRYSRRMAVMSNMLLGLWIFWSRFLTHIQKKNILGVIVPPLKQEHHPLNKLLYEGFMKAISKSWVFFAGAMLITRSVSWKRHIGLGLTTSYSLYLAIFSHFLPWTNYFNMFSNLLYITAAWTNEEPQAMTLNYFISPTTTTNKKD